MRNVERGHLQGVLSSCGLTPPVLSFAGVALDLYARERLQLVFQAALRACGSEVDMSAAWLLVEPSTLSPARQSLVERSQRCVVIAWCDLSGV